MREQNMLGEQSNLNDPLGFMRHMWGQMGFNLPGMVTPTFDIEELDKRIKDMKAVEGWLRMNLSMLQMTIQGLEMQRSTVSAVKTMGQMASDAAKSLKPEAPEASANPFAVNPENSGISGTSAGTAGAAMWPWQMMEQMREQMQHHADLAAKAKAEAEAAESEAKTTRRTKK
jgi:hypothetical protein